MKKLNIILIFLCISKLFAYDYPWPVDYEVKNHSLDETNKLVWNFISENPEYQVYDFYDGQYKLRLEITEPYKVSDYAKDWMTEKKILTAETYTFPESVEASIYLADVDTVVSFFIVKLATEQIFIRLTGYSSGYEIFNGKRRPDKGCKVFAFNDVEPVKKEIIIKKSFEENFLKKISLETEYVDPGQLDKTISKIMSFFRKRKNFVE